MKVKTFVVQPTGSQNNLSILTVPILGFQAVLKDNKIHNVEPFSLLVDERGMIHNYSARVAVSVLNLTSYQATWDSMSVFTIANTPVVQHVINNSLGICNSFNRWDAVLEQAERVNSRALEAAKQVELDMIMDDIMKMSVQQAIDTALDRRDKEMFQRLVRMRGGVAK